MRLLSCVPYLFLLVAGFAAAEEREKDVPELDIKTTYQPEECLAKARRGDGLKVHYLGTLYSNGRKFDSSYDRGVPLSITLGIGQVIKGWDDGLVDMCLNEKRRLTIPSRMAYGSRGYGQDIPGGSALVFEVELVGLEGQGRVSDEL